MGLYRWIEWNIINWLNIILNRCVRLMNMSFDIRLHILIDMKQMCGHIASTKKQYSNCYVYIYEGQNRVLHRIRHSTEICIYQLLLKRGFWKLWRTRVLYINNILSFSLLKLKKIVKRIFVFAFHLTSVLHNLYRLL